MNSSLIGRVQKAHRYAQERERLHFTRFALSFQGDHDTHRLEYDQGTWSCSCHSFSRQGICSHVMATEQILEGMLATPVSSAP